MLTSAQHSSALETKHLQEDLQELKTEISEYQTVLEDFDLLAHYNFLLQHRDWIELCACNPAFVCAFLNILAKNNLLQDFCEKTLFLDKAYLTNLHMEEVLRMGLLSDPVLNVHELQKHLASLPYLPKGSNENLAKQRSMQYLRKNLAFNAEQSHADFANEKLLQRIKNLSPTQSDVPSPAEKDFINLYKVFSNAILPYLNQVTPNFLTNVYKQLPQPLQKQFLLDLIQYFEKPTNSVQKFFKQAFSPVEIIALAKETKKLQLLTMCDLSTDELNKCLLAILPDPDQSSETYSLSEHDWVKLIDDTTGEAAKRVFKHFINNMQTNQESRNFNFYPTRKLKSQCAWYLEYSTWLLKAELSNIIKPDDSANPHDQLISAFDAWNRFNRKRNLILDMNRNDIPRIDTFLPDQYDLYVYLYHELKLGKGADVAWVSADEINVAAKWGHILMKSPNDESLQSVYQHLDRLGIKEDVIGYCHGYIKNLDSEIKKKSTLINPLFHIPGSVESFINLFPNATRAYDALLFCIKSGCISMCKQLLQDDHYTREDITGAINAIGCAKLKENIFLELIKHPNADLSFALKMAASYGFETVLTELVKQVVDINNNESARPPIVAAAENSQLGCVKILLAQPNINPNTASTYGKTALHYAVSLNNTEMIKILCDDERVDVNLTIGPRISPFIYALTYNKIPALLELLKCPRLNVNEKYGNETPLSYLLDPHYFNNEEKDVRIAILKALISHPKINIDQQYLLANCTVNDDDKLFNLLMSSPKLKLDFDTCSHILINGKEWQINTLMNHPAFDVNIRDSYYRTLLMYDLDMCNGKNIATLLQHPGIDVNKCENHHTALMLATLYKDTSSVEKLLKHKDIDVNVREDRSGNTALMLAIKSGKLDIINQLISFPGIEVNERNNKGDNPLLSAIKNDVQIVTKLLSTVSDVDVNIADGRGFTPLMCSVYHNHTEAFTELLKQKNINVNCTTNEWTPLLYAIFQGDIDKVTQLLAHKDINPNLKCSPSIELHNKYHFKFSKPITPLMLAVLKHSEKPDLLDALLTNPKLIVDKASIKLAKTPEAKKLLKEYYEKHRKPHHHFSLFSCFKHIKNHEHVTQVKCGPNSSK